MRKQANVTHRAVVKWIVSVCVLCFACGDASEHPDVRAVDAAFDADLDPHIEVGGGLLAYEPFGEEAEMVMGIQGGWHVDVSTRFFDIDAIDLQLTIVGVDPETNMQVTRTVDRLLQERHTDVSADGVRTRAGDRLILDIETPEDVAGRPLLIRVTGTSAGGVIARGEVSVVVVDRDP